MWPPPVTEILDGDLVAAFAYCTPAAGTVVLPVTTLGMFDAEAATVTTSTSFGNWKKLTRIERNDQVAFAFHAREHGTASAPNFLLVQGRATFPDRPDREWLESDDVVSRWNSRIPPLKRGRFWKGLAREYQEERVPITVHVERIVAWPDAAATGEPKVFGTARPLDSPAAQAAPANGTAPRVKLARYAKRLDAARNRLLGYVGADGFPVVLPVDLMAEGSRLHIGAPEPLPDDRRAGVLAHRFEPKLLGQTVVSFTGWLEADGREGTFAPHTVSGYQLPASKLAYSFGSALVSKFGYRAAIKAGHIRDGAWQRVAAT